MADIDPVLDSLTEELRVQMAALNDLHHPVIQGTPKRIADLTARITSLKTDIQARRKELAACAKAS